MAVIDKQLVHDIAAKHNVPASVAQELITRSRPCFFLVPYEEVPSSRRENIRPVARTGGLPALPDGTDWPEGREPLVLSVDCTALPRDVLDIELPAEGQLLFFTEIEYEPESSAVLHLPAGVPTTERSATYEIDGEPVQTTVYASRELYPLVGLTLADDWQEGPATSAFLDGDEDLLDGFEKDVLDAAAGGTRPGVCVQIGGFSNPWDVAPDEDGLVLFAQIAGQAIEYKAFTMNLIVGTPQDIADRRYANLQYEQQC